MDNVYIHPKAIVESKSIGKGTRIWAFTHVMKGVAIGAHCNVGEHCFLETGVVIGDNVTVKNGNELWDGVTLAEGVFVGPNVTFTNDLYPRSPRLPQAASRYNNLQWRCPTLVNEGASLGAGAIVLAGNVIGAFALVGAGALVTRDVPDYALVTGAPARVVGWVCQCGLQLRFEGATAACEGCRMEFVQNPGLVGLNHAQTVSAGVSNASQRRFE